MEIAIGIGIGLIIAAWAKNRRRGHNQPIDTATDTESKRLQQIDEEIVTVILPTINNDK